MIRTTEEMAEDAEEGWYFVRFMSGEDPGNPNDWEPWHCEQVVVDRESWFPMIAIEDRWICIGDLPDPERFQWGEPIQMPDEHEPTGVRQSDSCDGVGTDRVWSGLVHHSVASCMPSWCTAADAERAAR